MIEHVFSVRVRYSETDVMGYVHHSNYACYYETARWELFRCLGIPYKYLEELGYILPVIGMNFKFIKAATYDENLKIHTELKSIEGPRISFFYKMYNEDGDLINKAEVNLAFVDMKTRYVCQVPSFVIDAVTQSIPANYCK